MIKGERYLPVYKSPKQAFAMAGMLVLIYMLESSPFPSYVGSSNYNDIVKPLVWLGSAYIVWSLPRPRPLGRLRMRNMLNFWALNFGIIYIIVSVLAGLIDGLGRSPYSHEPMGIITNIISVGTALIGRELIRSQITNNLLKEENYLRLTIIALTMTVTGISFSRYTELSGYEGIVEFIAQYFAPDFANNLFATYLVFLGGPLSSSIYLGIITGFQWLSPVLPDLEWITTAFVGGLCPIFFLMTMQDIYTSEEKKRSKCKTKEESSLSWMITSVISIGIIWFAVGVFPIYPSVVATGSMEPEIKPGDVVLIRKIVDIEGIKSLKPGDVIQFERDKIPISHRIINIKEDERTGQISYRTKGDNNSTMDKEKVKPEQIKGIVVYTVPKVGWPTLLIKSKEDIPLEDVFF